MFIVIPLIIFITSFAAVFYLSIRKFSYLKKLNSNPEDLVPTTSETSLAQFIQQMFPEIFDYFHRIDVAAHKSSLLLEFEKFLRKARVAFLKIDNLSNNLIHKVRATHLEEAKKSQEKAEAKKIEELALVNGAVIMDESVQLKKQEHDLIVEIAKSPKNPVLYKSLGDIYITTKQWQYARESLSSALKLDPAIKGVKRKLELANKMLQAQGH